MKVSAIVSSYLIDDGKNGLLRKCIKSLAGHDELIVFAHKGLGFCEAWNTAASFATGDYLVLIGDNTTLDKGTLKDLAIEDKVVLPLVNGKQKEFNGVVICMPREIYEKHGLYDMVYNDGIHYMDDDLYLRLRSEGVPVITNPGVNFYHPQGGRTVNNIEGFEERVKRNNDIFFERWKV